MSGHELGTRRFSLEGVFTNWGKRMQLIYEWLSARVTRNDRAEFPGGNQAYVLVHHVNGAYLIGAWDDAGVLRNQWCRRFSTRMVCCRSFI